MATRKKAGSGRGPRWAELVHAIHHAGSALLCIASSQLEFLKPRGMPQDGRRGPVDLMYMLYEISQRLETLSSGRQNVAKGMLGTLFVTCTFIAFFLSAVSGGDRWVINPLISDFEYPQIPEHAIKVFVFCKYSFAVCVVYNMMRYAVDRKVELVELMDDLERDAAVMRPGQSTESRLDSTVPRANDDRRYLEARQLIAIRRLLHRGVFVFDIVPEPEPVTEPQPTEDDLQAIREAMELEAVKRLNDPRMLREYIRRRESRQGRRRVHLYKMKERRNKASRCSKGMRVDSPLNVIEEEDSGSLSFISDKRSHISNKSGKSQRSGGEPVKSESSRSWRINRPPVKADGDRLGPEMGDMLKSVCP